MTSRRINGSNTTPTYDGEDSSVFTIKLHIGGTLVWKPKVEYRDGFVEYFDYFNCDEGSLLDLRRMVQFWVKVKGITRRKKTEVRKVSTDAEILLLNLEVPTNKELEIYVEHLYDDQWDYEVQISRSLGDDALFSDVQEEGSEQESEREVEGPETVFEEVEVEVNGPTSKGVENEVEVDVNEVDCVHSEEIFRSLADSDSERDFNDSEIVFQERNLKKEGFKFVLGMIFQSASEFKWAVKYHEALRRKDVKFVKNEGRRVRACCRHNDICKWTIFGSRSNPRCPFQIKTYNPEHTCGDQDENKTVNSGFLARLYKDDFRLNMEWGRRQFQEHIRLYLMGRMQKNRDKMKTYPHKICPKIAKLLEEAKDRSARYSTYKSHDNLYQVDDHNFKAFKVDLALRQCSCRGWDLTGIPCSHAVAAIRKQRQSPEDYVHQCYSVDSYLRAYEPAILPIQSSDLWPKVDLPAPLPPKYKAQPGRPKKKRRTNPLQEKEQQRTEVRTKKLGEVKRCRVCGLTGHNKTTCKAKNPQVSEQFEDIAVETQVPEFVLDEMGSQEAVGSQSSQPLHNHAPQVSTFISSQTTTSTADEELLRIGLRDRTLAAIQRLGRPGKLYLIRKKQ
nr:uncharacterized protein LOC109193258 [Ipomoea trifida]